jgi:hypothetical protein
VTTVAAGRATYDKQHPSAESRSASEERPTVAHLAAHPVAMGRVMHRANRDPQAQALITKARPAKRTP